MCVSSAFFLGEQNDHLNLKESSFHVVPFKIYQDLSTIFFLILNVFLIDFENIDNIIILFCWSLQAVSVGIAWYSRVKTVQKI